jgi:competence protein ComEC
VGNIRIHLFLPPGGSGGNASSLAVMAESRGASVLILGDINDKSDEYMAKTRDLPTVSVLVAGHHGAKTATSQTILEKTSPKYVIISVGRNSFGHPAPETLDRIEAVGAEVRRTDINGTIFYRFYKGRVYER